LLDHQAVSCGFKNLCGDNAEFVHYKDPFDLREKAAKQPEIAASHSLASL
jgi:hypothetical protein